MLLLQSKNLGMEVCDLEILSIILEYRYVQKIILLANANFNILESGADMGATPFSEQDLFLNLNFFQRSYRLFY